MGDWKNGGRQWRPTGQPVPDTAEFAVNAIRRWWTRMGRHRFPRARTLVITADGGGSNGPRSRLWKWALQRLADDFDLTLSVCHLPSPHQQMEQDRTPLLQLHLAELARETAGQSPSERQLDRRHDHTNRLRVKAALDTLRYETARQVPDDEFARLRVTPHAFHGDGNYTIHAQ